MAKVRVSKNARDVQFHAAVTIMPNAGGRPIIGEKEIEIGQFAVEFPARGAPFTEEQIRMAFGGLCIKLTERLRAAGYVK